ncbi:MAG: VPLPA-CTERM sorting domain-containing protein [Phycisphaerales bacterium]
MNNVSKMALLALAASAGAATAADFMAEFEDIHGRNQSILIDGVAQNAGHMEYTYSGPIPTNAVGQFRNNTFFTFCIELQQVSRNPEPWDIRSISDAPNPASSNGGMPYGSSDEQEVHAVMAAAISLGWLNSDLSLGTASQNELAAIQGMIWKVLFDGSTVEGNTGGVIASMATLEAAAAADPNARVQNLRAMSNPDAQDQLYIVPLPTAALAGLAMLGGLAGARLRRR